MLFSNYKQCSISNALWKTATQSAEDAGFPVGLGKVRSQPVWAGGLAYLGLCCTSDLHPHKDILSALSRGQAALLPRGCDMNNHAVCQEFHHVHFPFGCLSRTTLSLCQVSEFLERITQHNLEKSEQQGRLPMRETRREIWEASKDFFMA